VLLKSEGKREVNFLKLQGIKLKLNRALAIASKLWKKRVFELFCQDSHIKLDFLSFNREKLQ